MPSTPSENSLEARAVRTALSEARRDWAGFIEGEQPNLSELQFTWLSARLGVSTDAEACAATEIGPETIALWRLDASFAAIEAISTGNKREGFRMLATHLLPKGLRVINGLLDSIKPADRVKGLTLLLRVQGLLVDKVAVIGKDELAVLFERLRAPVEMKPLPGPSVDGEFTES